MEGCIFCGIVSGKIPSYKIWEDDEFVAFLGIFPSSPGMTVVATKKHTGSYVYQTLSDEDLTRFHLFAKKVALLLDRALGSIRTVQVMEGLEVDHPHLKLYPVYKDVPYVRGEGKVKASDEEMKKVAEKIRQSK